MRLFYSRVISEISSTKPIYVDSSICMYMFVLRLCDLSSFILSLMYNYAVHCRCGFSIPGVAICMLIAFSFLIIRAMKVFYNLFKYWEIRQFYITALKIESVSIADIDVARLCSFILQLLVKCMFSVRAGFHSITTGWPNAAINVWSYATTG